MMSDDLPSSHILHIYSAYHAGHSFSFTETGYEFVLLCTFTLLYATPLGDNGTVGTRSLVIIVRGTHLDIDWRWWTGADNFFMINDGVLFIDLVVMSADNTDCCPLPKYELYNNGQRTQWRSGQLSRINEPSDILFYL